MPKRSASRLHRRNRVLRFEALEDRRVLSVNRLTASLLPVLEPVNEISSLVQIEIQLDVQRFLSVLEPVQRVIPADEAQPEDSEPAIPDIVSLLLPSEDLVIADVDAIFERADSTLPLVPGKADEPVTLPPLRVVPSSVEVTEAPEVIDGPAASIGQETLDDLENTVSRTSSQLPVSVPESLTNSSELPVADKSLTRAEDVTRSLFDARSMTPRLNIDLVRDQPTTTTSIEANAGPSATPHLSTEEVATSSTPMLAITSVHHDAEAQEGLTASPSAGVDSAGAELVLVDAAFGETAEEAAALGLTPEGAELQAEAGAFDRTALDAALGQFLAEVGDLGEQAGSALGGLEVIAYLAAVTVGLAGAEMGRRRRRQTQPALGLVPAGAGGTLTWLPGSTGCDL